METGLEKKGSREDGSQ
ncbi:hypothetical protein NPIL_85681, partial [Nephila pilipes]